MQINHIGIACDDIERTLDYIKGIYTIVSISPVIYDEFQKVKVCMAEIQGSVPIEFVCGETVSAFIENHISIYHICYECENIYQEIEKYKANGATVISSPKPALLFDNRLVSFLNTKIGMIELLEKEHSNVTFPVFNSGRQSEIRITATFTADPLQKYMDLICEKLEFNKSIKFSEYNQVFQTLLSSEIQENPSEFHIILLRVEDWVYYLDPERSDLEKEIKRNADDFIEIMKQQAGKCNSHFIVALCPESISDTPDNGKNSFAGKIEALIEEELSNIDTVSVICSKSMVRQSKDPEYYCDYSQRIAHIPYSERFYKTLAVILFRKMMCIRGYPYKVIVADCDETLWDGTVSEVGYEKLEISQPRRWLQTFLVKQYEAGMLICLCSKNEEEDILEVFKKRKDMVLTLDQITDYRINRQSKAKNIRLLADRLNLGLDSFIFIDDNFLECMEVSENIPEALVLQLPENRNEIQGFIQNNWVFDHHKVTYEDKLRTSFYKENLTRESVRQNAVTLEKFVEELVIETSIAGLKESEIERAVQLEQRTNQFHLSNKRKSKEEIKALKDGGGLCYCVHVKDRMGDYGIVGFITCMLKESLIVDTFLLSCRAFGRGIEQEMLIFLRDIAHEAKVGQIKFEFRDNRKNGMLLEFFRANHGVIKENGFGSKTILLNCDQIKKKSVSAFKSAKKERKGNSRTAVYPLYHKIQDIINQFNSFNGLPESALKDEKINGRDKESIVRYLKEQYKSLTKYKGVMDESNHFFEIGGNSLMGVRLISDIFHEFSAELLLEDIFEYPTIEALGSHIIGKLEGSSDSNFEDINFELFVESEKNLYQEKYALSGSQFSTWCGEVAFPENWGNNMPLVLQIDGLIHLDAFHHAVNEVVKRHASLRTKFMDQSGIPYQVIEDSFKVRIEIEDYMGISEQALNDIIDREEANKLFITELPLFRLRLLKIDNNKYILLFTIHHLIFDGWSYSVFFQDLAVFYNGYLNGEAVLAGKPHIRYVDFVQWEKTFAFSKKYRDTIHYWKKRLAGLDLYELPADCGAGKDTPYGVYYPVKLHKETAAKLKRACLNYNISLFTLLMTSYQLTLCKFMNIEDIAVGTIVSIRNSRLLDEVIGFFVNAVVCRLKLEPDAPLKEILLQNKQIIIEAVQNGQVPFGDVIQALRPGGYEKKDNPFYHSMFVFQNTPKTDYELNGLQIRKYKEGYNIARGDLILELEEEDDSIFGGFYYNGNYFQKRTIEGLYQRFQSVLSAVVTQPKLGVKEMGAFAEEEKSN